jgi:hypothetical protein
MVNYKNAKIYKLVNDELNLTYYGSTCDELRKRLYGHKNKSNSCKSKIMFESGEVKIYLVEKFPCNDRIELNQKERYYIENNKCINKNIPTRTQKEYYIDNKEKITEYKKEYYHDNKDKKKQQKKEYREKNKDKMKEYYNNNKDKIKEYKKKYYQKTNLS